MYIYMYLYVCVNGTIQSKSKSNSNLNLIYLNGILIESIFNPFVSEANSPSLSRSCTGHKRNKDVLPTASCGPQGDSM